MVSKLGNMFFWFLIARDKELFILPVDLMQILGPTLVLSQQQLLLNLVKDLSGVEIEAQIIICWH